MTELTTRFISAFNRMDAVMRKRCKMDVNYYDFSKVLDAYEKRHSFKERNFVRRMNRLRNVIVHDNLDPRQEIATPSALIVQRMERIAKELETAENMETRFLNRGVTTVGPNDTMDMVLRLMAEKDFSQFPVFDGEQIVGLLTENGISRWLSSIVGSLSLVDFAEERVRSVLGREEERPNMILVSLYQLVDQVSKCFADNPLLEAAVITQTGKTNQPPLGIFTRWDLIGNTD